MKTLFKQPLIIISTLILLAIVGYVLFTIFRPPETTPADYFSSYTESQPPITFQLTDTPSTPAQLPIYELQSTPYSQSQIEQIAQGFGFTELTYMAPDDGFQGEVWTYSNNQANLRILPQARVIDYKKPTLTEPVAFTQYPDENFLYQQGIQYLQQQNLISNPEALVPYQQKPLSEAEDGQVRPNQPAIYISVSYLKTIDNYPLYAETYSTGVVTLNFNSDFQITAVYIDDLPQLSNPQMHLIKDLQTVQQTATTQASIQSLTNENIDPYELYTLPIERIIINELELGYVQEYEVSAQSIQPTYILKGTAFLQNIDETAEVVLYLPAIQTQ